MTDLRWRSKAKDVLYCYFTNQQRLREIEQDLLYRTRTLRDHRHAKGSIVDNTALTALALSRDDTESLRRAVRAVQLLIGKLSTDRRIDRDRLSLLKLVYFQGITGVYGAAVRLEISERTAKRWNDQALRFIAQHMGWLDLEHTEDNH